MEFDHFIKSYKFYKVGKMITWQLSNKFWTYHIYALLLENIYFAFEKYSGSKRRMVWELQIQGPGTIKTLHNNARNFVACYSWE